MYTRHGHQIEGTVVESPRPLNVARCGGPGLCSACSKDAASAPKEYSVQHDENTLYKVNDALRRSGLDAQQTRDAITELQNSGILFRERA